MQPSLELKTGDASVFKFEIAKKLQEKEIPLEHILESLNDLGFQDTGLMPRKDTGLINYRRAAGYETFVFQVAAGKNRIIWGARESDPNAKTYDVAMPYRIIIGDHMWNGKSYDLVGARHFYSYKPISSWDDILYNCNVPNLNCKGYSGNGVGWICLYHKQSYQGFDLKKRILATCMRTSGGEAYNDANMSGTDGTRYYQAAGKPSYFWDPKKWENKTKKEGWQWTIDESSDLLMPVMLKNPALNEMSANVRGQGAKPASLFDLTRGLYRAYYSHPIVLKPHNLMDPNNPFVSKYPKQHVKATYKHILEFFDGKIRGMANLAGKKTRWTPVITMITCDLTGGKYPDDDKWLTYLDKDLNEKKAHAASVQAGGTASLLINTYVKMPNGELKMALVPKADCRKGSHNFASYYHCTVETATCNTCSGVYMNGGNHKPHYDKIKQDGICTSCRTKIRCSSCERLFYQGDEVVVTPTPLTKILIEDVKKAILQSAKTGEPVKPSTVKVGVTEPVVICRKCAGQSKICMCGHLTTNRRVTGIHQSTRGGTVVCDGCTIMDTTSKQLQHLPNHIVYSTSMNAVKLSKVNGI